jgi:hypothetical protein
VKSEMAVLAAMAVSSWAPAYPAASFSYTPRAARGAAIFFVRPSACAVGSAPSHTSIVIISECSGPRYRMIEYHGG